jgi:hypothetical protein
LLGAATVGFNAAAPAAMVVSVYRYSSSSCLRNCSCVLEEYSIVDVTCDEGSVMDWVIGVVVANVSFRMKRGRDDDTTKALLELTATAKIRRRLLKDDIALIGGELRLMFIKMLLKENCVMDGDHKTVMWAVRIVPGNRTSQESMSTTCHHHPARAVFPNPECRLVPILLLIFRSRVVFHW